METLADRLESARERLGVSGREVARRAGMHESQYGVTLKRLRENPDGEVSVPVMKALARALNVSEAWLITGRGAPDDRDDAAQAPAPADVDVAGQRPVAADAVRSHRPTFGNLPDWPELLAGARQIAADRGREIPDWAWREIEGSGPLATASPTPAVVYEMARICADHGIGKPRPAPEREVSGVTRKAKGEG